MPVQLQPTGGALLNSTLTTINTATVMNSGDLASFIATESGANNALVVALNDWNGVAVILAAGIIIKIQLAHTLQAGVNTLVFNGSSAIAIRSHFNSANTIATAYAATGIISLIYNGTFWLDMSQ